MGPEQGYLFPAIEIRPFWILYPKPHELWGFSVWLRGRCYNQPHVSTWYFSFLPFWVILSLASDNFFTLVLINILLDTWRDCRSPRNCVMCSLSVSLPSTSSSFVLSLSPVNSSHFGLSRLLAVSCQLGKLARLYTWVFSPGSEASETLKAIN